MAKLLRDMVGNELQAGDVIAYATNLGRSATLKLGVILRIEWVEHFGTKMHVVSALYDGESWRKCKRGVLLFSSRVIRLDLEQIDEDVYYMLKDLENAQSN